MSTAVAKTPFREPSRGCIVLVGNTILGPFRGSAAIAAGWVTPDQLRGPRFRRLFPDIFLAADQPADLANRSRGAALLAPGEAVLSGYSAAELLGAHFAAPDASAEITVPGRDFREQPGLSVHRDLLVDDEVTTVGGLPVTTLLRTAWDLVRWHSTVDGVIALDTLARHGQFEPEALLRFYKRHVGARWCRRVATAVDLSDPLAESPMETRSRLLVVLRGTPKPVLQHEVYEADGRFVARLDMVYKELRLGIEYDGRGHLEPGEQDRGARRGRALDALDWSIITLTSPDIFVTPDDTFAAIQSRYDHLHRRLRP